MAAKNLIKIYGLFWREDRVNWGAGRNKGTLLGYSPKAKRSPYIDFREQIGIYVLYRDFKMVYVGQAGGGDSCTIFTRLKAHRCDAFAERWDRFSWFGLLGVKKGDGKLTKSNIKNIHPSINSVLNHMEAILIAAAEPALNVQRGRFTEVVGQYNQYYEEEE